MMPSGSDRSSTTLPQWHALIRHAVACCRCPLSSPAVIAFGRKTGAAALKHAGSRRPSDPDSPSKNAIASQPYATRCERSGGNISFQHISTRRKPRSRYDHAHNRRHPHLACSLAWSAG